MSRRILGLLKNINRKNMRVYQDFTHFRQTQPSPSSSFDKITDDMAYSKPLRLLTRKSVRIGKNIINKKRRYLKATKELNEAYDYITKVRCKMF